jgi:hypothetical protein
MLVIGFCKWTKIVYAYFWADLPFLANSRVPGNSEALVTSKAVRNPKPPAPVGEFLKTLLWDQQ